MLKKTALLLMILSLSIRAADCTTTQVQLGLCQQLVKDLGTENALLQQKIGILTKQRDDTNLALAKATEPAIIPGWGWLLIGLAAGAGTYAIIRK